MRIIIFVKRLVFVAAMGIAFNHAIADELTHRKELAGELVNKMNLEERYTKLIPALRKTMRDAMVRQNPEFEKDVNEIVDLYFNDFRTRLNELMRITADIYALHFTSEELEQLTAFYKSPIGVKLVGQSSAIATESLEAAAKWNEAGRSKLEEKLNSLEEKNCCKSHPGAQ